MVEYGETKTVNRPFDEVVEEVINLLESEGFGIITEINVKTTLKKKLDIEYDNYRILGACNPNLAHQALETEKEIGLLLPCNVIIYEKNGNTIVGTMRPTKVMSLSDNPELNDVAEDVERSMKSVIEQLQ
jgi:uncharacterized protein (DUF302 family)